MAGQKGVGAVSVVRTGVLIAALGATAYSRVVGQRVPAVANAQRQLDLLQWVVPALAGVMLILNALQGEQQRPTSVARGVVDRIVGN